MPDYLTPKLPNRVIPLTKNCDRTLSVQRKDSDGDPVDWDADVYMEIDVSRTEVEQIDGAVSDSVATIHVGSEITNVCKSGTTWRVVMSQAGDPTVETPLLVGVFERNDGK